MTERKTTRYYTVVLLFPDYLADNYGQDTVTVWVRAADPDEAQLRAQEKAWEPYRDEYGDGADRAVDLDDFFVIAAFRGKHADIKE